MAALAQFVGSLPTFTAVILAWMNSNARISDSSARVGDMRSGLEKLFQAEAASLRTEMRRVEEVMDARLKHLEERER